MTLNQSLQKHTGFWAYTAFIIPYILSDLFVDIFNINQTIGWSLDIGRSSWISYILAYAHIIYSIIYILIFTLQKKETHLFISKIHIAILMICGILSNFVEFDIKILLFFTTFSIIIFFTNLYVSLSNQKGSD